MLSLSQNKKLIILHKKWENQLNNGSSLLRFAACNEPIAGIAFSCLSGSSAIRSRCHLIAIPQDWAAGAAKAKPGIIYYKENLPVPAQPNKPFRTNSWFTISNGRYVTQIDYKLLDKILEQNQADVIAINVVSHLHTAYEKVLITRQNSLVGFRHLYNDLAQPATTPDDWPHYLFIKAGILNKLLVNNALALDFSEIIKRCSLNSLTVKSFNIGGTVLDLETESGLLASVLTELNSSKKNYYTAGNNSSSQIIEGNNSNTSDTARLFGKILFGKNVSIGQDAIIVGPAVIGDNVNISKGAVIRTSIIGPGVSIPQNHIVQGQILIDSRSQEKPHRQDTGDRLFRKYSSAGSFRTWPHFSYAGCFKRIADIIAATIVIILFAPIIPFVALAVKFSSPGPVFFRDRRQGLHGKVFNCLKFRTMIVGADKIQDKLRFVNQVDGPQFKLSNDPRISTVGKFLRDTYIDEMPQFLNVLLGHMSVIGPRPSPEIENTLCPPWRDARLSVRPGITGLWQVHRTRQQMKDFQEWILYDIKYVRNLYLKTDLWICLKTVKKLVKNFFEQF